MSDNDVARRAEFEKFLVGRLDSLVSCDTARDKVVMRAAFYAAWDARETTTPSEAEMREDFDTFWCLHPKRPRADSYDFMFHAYRAGRLDQAAGGAEPDTTGVTR